MLVDAFLSISYGQLAAMAGVLFAITAHAWWVRGRIHFFSEMLVYLLAFLTMADAQQFGAPNKYLIGLLALSLDIHVVMIMRDMFVRIKEDK